jgi:hypothetical protein
LLTKRLPKHGNTGVGRQFQVPVICSCRLWNSENRKAIQCNECKEYYHQDCKKVANSFFLKRNKNTLFFHGKYQCPVCDYNLIKLDQIEKHIDNMHMTQVNCTVKGCSLTSLLTKWDLEEHMDEKHRPVNASS